MRPSPNPARAHSQVELYTVPFADRYIIYRPLARLAFIGNRAMAEYAEARAAGAACAPVEEADSFLQAIDFWRPDPPPPAPWSPAGPHRPTMAVLLMTSACNLRCVYCYARGGEDDTLWMDLPLARRVIDTACEHALSAGQSSFALAFHGGGEPTLNWPVLVKAVEHARHKPLPCNVSMATNGVWTAAQRKFILDNFDDLSLSFDGVRLVQDAQRPRADGRGSFRAVMGTVRALEERGFPYGIRLTVMPQSFSRLPESIAFLCRETRQAVMQVEPCYATVRGEYADPTERQADGFATAFLAAFEVAAAQGRTVFYSGARPWLLTSSFCRAPEEALVVTPEGDVVPCFETHDRRHPLLARFRIGRATAGSVSVDPRRVRSFAARQARRRAACRGCFCYWHCGGDCASRCLTVSRPNPLRCTVNRRITGELLAWYIAAGDGVWQGAPPPGSCEPAMP